MLSEEDQLAKRQKLEDVSSSSGNSGTTVIENPSASSISPNDNAALEYEEHEKFILTEKNFVLNSDKTVVYPTNVPSKPDNNLRWIERIGTFHFPHASFLFEIIYQYTYKEPGFEYQWQYLPYAGHCLNRWMMYCVVSAVSPSFSNVISVGDIVVKMNDESLLYKPGDKVDLKTIGTKLHDSLKTLKNPITLRFFRVSGHTNNTLPSPAELNAVIFDKGTMYRFLVKVNIRGDSTVVSLDQSSADPQAPSSIKKSIQGNKLQWQMTPNLPAAPLSANTQINMQTSYSNPTNSIPSSSSFPSKEGVIKDGKKWSVYVFDHSCGSKVLYHLGSFDKEDEANRLYVKALNSSKVSGKFNMRHYLLNYKAPSETPQTLVTDPEPTLPNVSINAPIDYTSLASM